MHNLVLCLICTQRQRSAFFSSNGRQLWLKLFTLDAMDPLPQLPEHEAMPRNVSTRRFSLTSNCVDLTQVVVVNR